MAGDDAFAARDGFELLSDETRFAILLALAERLRDRPEEPAMSFSELRERVGMRDSGNFNYHLGRFDGRFVARTDDGYRITAAGIKVVAAIISGAYGRGATLGPVELEDPCPVCGGPLTAVYEDGLFEASCPEDHRFADALPPGAVEERSLEAVVDLLTLQTTQHVEMAVDGSCPYCYAPLEWAVDTSAPPEGEVATRCERCGVQVAVPLVAAVTSHPAVVSFYHDHGLDVRSLPPWAEAFFDGVAVEPAAAPDRLRLAIELEGDRIQATIDEELSVVTVEGRPASADGG